MTPSPSIDESQGDELLKLVREHLIDVDQHGYVEGEDDVVASRELRALIDREKAELLDRIEAAGPHNHVNPSLHRKPYVEENYDNGFNDSNQEWREAITAERNSLTQKADAGKEGL
jgi:hypothetical protein